MRSNNLLAQRARLLKTSIYVTATRWKAESGDCNSANYVNTRNTVRIVILSTNINDKSSKRGNQQWEKHFNHQPSDQNKFVSH